LRLAKFNIDTRQTDSFIGLPTPANAILIGSFPLILEQLPADHQLLPYTLVNPYFLLGLVALMSFLLVSEIPMFSLKFKNFLWQDNKIRFIFVGLTIALLALFQFIAVPFVIAGYIGLSIFNNQKIEN
jgi:CDP-diacylglycerol--serine O-phosphatidyltransferase